MEYKKIKKDNKTFHLINTDRFKTMNIVVFFTKLFDKNDIKFGNMLASNLVYSSKKYNTKNKMAIIGEDLYGSKVSASFNLVGKCEQFVFSLDFLNPKYTDEKYLEKNIDFLKEIILNPNVENSRFKQECFDIIKNDLISNINSIKDNPNLYSAIEYAKVMYKGTPCSYSSIPSIKELEKVDSENLYDFYKTLINGSFKVDIVCIGELGDNLLNLLYNKFKLVKSSNDKLSFDINHKYSDKVNTKIDSLPYNQSKLYVGYSLEDLTYHEMNHILRVYNTILGTMNDSLLFNIVREANSLCYSIGSYTNRYNSSLTIYAGINKNNYEKSLELIKKCVLSMSEIKYVKRLFDSAKKTINTYINNYYDDMIMQINNKYYSEFDMLEDIEELRNNINLVTIEEVINLNKKIKLNTVYLLKGDNND